MKKDAKNGLTQYDNLCPTGKFLNGWRLSQFTEHVINCEECKSNLIIKELIKILEEETESLYRATMMYEINYDEVEASIILIQETIKKLKLCQHG